MSAPYKLMITVRKAPHGTIYVHEAVEIMFIMASFDMDLSVVFLDDGVYALKQGQNTKELGIKGFSASLGALADWDVKNVYVEEKSLKDRNIDSTSLISIGEDDETDEILHPKVLTTAELKQMMHSQDSVMSL